MITVYGLDNCSTCRKARDWLDAHGVKHAFVDYREQPIPAADLKRYAKQLSWEKLVNRASYTWRGLPDERKSPASDAEWTALIGEHPALVRRPLLVLDDGSALAGFSAQRYAELPR